MRNDLLNIPARLLLFGSLALFGGTAAPASAALSLPTQERDTVDQVGIYTCPMHPSVRHRGPGKCPICGMTLTPVHSVTGSGTDSDRAIFHVDVSKQQEIGVKHDSVAVRLIAKSVKAYGNVGYDERKVAVVNLRYAGWIDSLAADYDGKFVNKGDLLLKIYSPEAQAAEREHLLSRTHASDTLWSVDGNLGGGDFASATRERLEYLGLSPGQIGALEDAGEVSRTLDVFSPVTGNIVGKTATAGMYVEPGTTLYRIADLSTVWLNAEIFQKDLPDVRTGREAVIRFGEIPGREFRGNISFIDPVLGASTRSARARIEIANADGALKPGMFGNVTIGTTGRYLLSVPVNAVLNTGTREIAFVAGEGDVIEARLVRTGERNGRWIEILSGLSAGERVISSANFLIDAESRIQGVLDRLRQPEEVGHGNH